MVGIVREEWVGGSRIKAVAAERTQTPKRHDQEVFSIDSLVRDGVDLRKKSMMDKR